jgi:two-component system, OmpR family, response regulator
MTGKRIRILVVDDEENIPRGLRAWLEDEAFEVMTAASGEEALEILQGDPSDGAIVDIRLPGMDGNAFMEQAHRLCPKMRFLVYTGSVTYSPPARLKALGVQEKDMFQKPLRDTAVLVAAVRDRIMRPNQ